MLRLLPALLVAEKKYFQTPFQPSDIIAILFLCLSGWLFHIGESAQGKEIIYIILGYYFGRQNLLVTRPADAPTTANTSSIEKTPQ